MEKTDAVLQQDMAPSDLPLSTCKQDLKCVLVALFEYVFIIEQLVKNIKAKEGPYVEKMIGGANMDHVTEGHLRGRVWEGVCPLLRGVRREAETTSIFYKVNGKLERGADNTINTKPCRYIIIFAYRLLSCDLFNFLFTDARTFL